MAQTAEHSAVRMIPGWQMDDGRYVAGIEMALGYGWKTYWRQPGAAGIPPHFDWELSDNIADVQIEWPTPDVFATYGMQTIGYTDHVTFPIIITPIDASHGITAQLSLSYGVCSDICVPAQSDLSMSQAPSTRANQSILQDARQTGVAQAGVAECDLIPNGDGFVVTSDITLPYPITDAAIVVFELDNPDVWIDGVEITQGAFLHAEAQLDYFGEGAFFLDRSALRISVIEPGVAVYDIHGC